MRKNFKGEARKARRVNAYCEKFNISHEEIVADPSLLRSVGRAPFVSRYWDKRYYIEKEQAIENSFWAAQKETAPALHLQEQIEGLSKAIKAKEKALKALMKDIEELSSKKEDLLFIMRNI